MSDSRNKFVLERDNFQQLLEVLTKRGYRVVGPTVRDGAIVYDTLSSMADLPSGWTDEQNGERIACADAKIRPCWATRLDHTPGRSCCIRRS
jgi:hypothetical protein